MRKIIVTIGLVVLGGILASSAMAATTISFSPTNINVNSGEDFNLVISLDPQGIKNYTVKAEVDYPSDLLEVKSFNFSQDWMAITQSGYDLIDNTNGRLIKTAGYPGGISAAATFGTITFSAKKAGQGTINLGSDSIALDSGNQNLLAGPLSQSSVEITAPAAPSTQPSTPAAPPALKGEVIEGEATPPTEEEIVIPEGEKIVEELTQEPQETPSLLAAIGNLVTLGTGKVWIGIIISVIILLIIYFVIRRIRLKKSK